MTLELFSILSSQRLEVIFLKIFKIFLCIVFTITIGTCSSTISIGKSQNFTNKPDEATGSSAMSDEDNNAAACKINDDGILVLPKYNCDPHMLIPGNPNIDPHFLVKLNVTGDGS